jgi:hypothetical protein
MEDFSRGVRLNGTAIGRSASMSEHEAEDLELEGMEADAIIGGHGSPPPNTEIETLALEGYIEQACTTEGTVLYNPKTKQRKLVKV